MFKVYGVVEIPRIEFFNFSVTERFKQNRKKLKTFRNLVSQSLFKKVQQKPIFFKFFTKNLTLSLPVPRWAGANIDLTSSSNISKTVGVNIVLTEWFLKSAR